VLLKVWAKGASLSATFFFLQKECKATGSREREKKSCKKKKVADKDAPLAQTFNQDACG
jgi:hypothetical protein